MKNLLLKNLLIVNLFLFMATWILGMDKENGDVNAAGMYLVVTFPYWLLFNVVNLFLVGFSLQSENNRHKIVVLVLAALLSFACLIILHPSLVLLLGIWIGITALIDLWTLTRRMSRKE